MEGRNNIGGIVGHLSSGATPSIVEYCYFMGSVSGSEKVGGVIGDINTLSGSDTPNSNNKVYKCYATGTVTGTNYVGGVAGYVYNGNLTNSAALNQWVRATGTGASAGRVVGGASNAMTGEISGNIAFSGMTTNGGAAFPAGQSTSNGNNGANITATEINTDRMLGNRFTEPWITETGKLPSFVSPVNMPSYL